jgi:hypothetical protein
MVLLPFAFEFGVPMLPKPKSEAWLLCAGKTARAFTRGIGKPFQETTTRPILPKSSGTPSWEALRLLPKKQIGVPKIQEIG